MFDTLLSFIKENQEKLIPLYLEEYKKNGEGLFTIIQDKRNVHIQYYTKDVPYKEIMKEYMEKKIQTESKEIKVENKWIITLPILELDTKDTFTIPVWNLVLDNGDKQIFFQGFPQEVDIQNGKGLQFVLVGEPENKDISINHWTVECTTTGKNFIEVCKEASMFRHKFMTFRSDSSFNKIIIPGTKEQGQKILDRISVDIDVKDWVEKCKKNDEIGSPITYMYRPYGYISPNTLRYMNSYYEIQKYFGNIENYDIVEFGGGYGGLCNILSQMISWKSYTFIEIKELVELAKKCFYYFPDQKVDCITYNDIDTKKKYDLFIGEYSFCELQEEGIQKNIFLLQNSKNAYLVMNTWDAHKKETYKKMLFGIFNIIEEYPVFPNSEWGDYVWICKQNICKI